MFKAFCERIGLTKSNLRAIWRMIWRMKYPPVKDPGGSEFWLFTGLFFLFIWIGRWELPLIPLAFVVLVLTWATRWMIFLILRMLFLLAAVTISLVQIVWNEIPEEGRKKKKREEKEDWGRLILVEPGDPLIMPPPPKDLRMELD